MKELFDKNKIDNPDDFYEYLITAHEGLCPGESRQLNSRLILLLANEVGDITVIKKMIKKARESLEVC